MQFQSDRQPLLARHLTITSDLFFQRAGRGHNLSIIHSRFTDNCGIHCSPTQVDGISIGCLPSTPMNRRSILGDMKASYVLSFLCGAAVMLGFSTLRGSNAESPHHVYELRLYHVNEGKMDALKARFGNHTDSIFKRHNMKSIGYWSPEDAPSSQNLFIYILEHPSRQEGEKNWAAFQADPEWQKVKAESEAHGSLVDHIDRYFMDPTSFSALN